MKIFMILIAALFPFLHNTPYEVQISDCQKDQIIVESQGSKLNLSLFNIHLKNENAWKKTCSILMEADHVTMEIDPTTQINEKLSVYLFGGWNAYTRRIMLSTGSCLYINTQS